MKIYRRRFGRWLDNLSGGGGHLVALAQAEQSYIDRANKFWAIVFVIVVVVSAAICLANPASFGTQMFLALLWGVFLGITLLFFAPRNGLITLIGAFIGGGITGASSLTSALHGFTDISDSVTMTLNSYFGSQILIYKGPVLVLLFLILVCCLPAYRGQE